MDSRDRIQLYERAPRDVKQTLLGLGLKRHKRSIYLQVEERERRAGRWSNAHENPLCLLCGEPAVDIHELKYRSTRRLAAQFKMYHVKNCAPLCRRCHDEVHDSMKARERLRQKMRTLYRYEYDRRGCWPEFYIDQAVLASEWLERYGVLQLAWEGGII